MTKLQATLLDRFTYEPDTGKLIWRKNGKEAGTLHQFGYIQVNMDYKLYKAHNLIWALVNGAFPQYPLEIDHIDRQRANNRLSNLRLVTHSQNRSNNAAEGVSFHTRDKRWQAYITIDGVYKHLGYFETYEAAKKVREVARG